MSELLLVKGVAATEVEKKSIEELQLDVYLNVYLKNFVDSDIQKKVIRFKKQSGLK